jgi:hypothetical protein
MHERGRSSAAPSSTASQRERSDSQRRIARARRRSSPAPTARPTARPDALARARAGRRSAARRAREAAAHRSDRETRCAALRPTARPSPADRRRRAREARRPCPRRPARWWCCHARRRRAVAPEPESAAGPRRAPWPPAPPSPGRNASARPAGGAESRQVARRTVDFHERSSSASSSGAPGPSSSCRVACRASVEIFRVSSKTAVMAPVPRLGPWSTARPRLPPPRP